MKKLFLVIALLTAQRAQGKITWVQDTNPGGTNPTPTFYRNVTSGNTILIYISFGAQGFSSVSAVDTRSTIYAEVAHGVKTNCNSSGWDWYSYVLSGTLTSSGADTITVTLTATGTLWPQYAASEFSGVGAVDVSVGDTFANTNTAQWYLSSALASTQNNELLVSTFSWPDQYAVYQGFSSETDAISGIQTNDLQAQFRFTTAPGNYTMQVYGSHNSCAAMTTAVFKPATFNVTTAATIDATQNQSFSQTLQAEGGTGALTWAKSAGTLPPGITLNSSGVLAGTSAYKGTFNFTARATDTLAATATSAFTFKVGSGHDTVTVVQSQEMGSNPLAFTSNVTAGNLVHVAFFWDMNSGIPTLTAPYDTLGTPFALVCMASETMTYQAVFVGVAPSSGADTVTVSGAIFPKTFLVGTELSNYQSVLDGCSTKTGADASGDTLTSTALSTTGQDEMLLGTGSSSVRSGPCVLTAVAPFTPTVAGAASGKTETNIEAATGSYTAQFTVSGGGCTADSYEFLLQGLFPTVQDFTPTPMGRAMVSLMQ
jgi:hypothetical protein